MSEKEEVYIYWYIKYMRLAIDLLPLKIRNKLIQGLMGEGMRTFKGREQHAHKE